MKKGIVLIALGRPGYAYAAYNIAYSIKKNSDVHIHLLHDGCIGYLHDRSVFDTHKKLPKKIYTNRERLDPGKAKIHIYEYLPFDYNLYLDVDAICLKDINPLIDKLLDVGEYYITDVRGTGGVNDDIEYSIWADQNEAYDFFGIPKKNKFSAIQSSYCFIKKGKKAKRLFDLAIEFYNKQFPLDRLKMQWGGTMPDELIFSCALAKLNYVPKGNIKPIYFGMKIHPGGFQGIKDNFYFLSLYGNGIGKPLVKRKYIKWYDRMMVKYTNNNHQFKTLYIMKDKHVNSMKT